MRTIAIANQKGGTGKTTTTVNLAAALAESRRRVLVVDLDPQASASMWLGVKDGGRGLYDLFTDGVSLSALVRQTGRPELALVPSSPWLHGVDKALAREIGVEGLLSRKLRELSPREWDYVLFDCPPTLGVLAVNALAASRELLIPVEAHVLSLNGLVQLLRTVEVAKERLNPDLEICGIVVCRLDGRNRHSGDVASQLRERFGALVYAAAIRESIRLAESPSFAKTILEYGPDSRGARDFRDLAREVIAQEKEWN